MKPKDEKDVLLRNTPGKGTAEAAAIGVVEQEDEVFAGEEEEYDALMTTREEPKGCLVLDSGATPGVGSIAVLEALEEERVNELGQSNMRWREGK